MSVLHAEVLEAFRSIDVPEDKAIRAATALSASLAKLDDETMRGSAKRDDDIEATRKDVQSRRVDTAVLKWMAGFNLAIGIAVLFKVSGH